MKLKKEVRDILTNVRSASVVISLKYFEEKGEDRMTNTEIILEIKEIKLTIENKRFDAIVEAAVQKTKAELLDYFDMKLITLIKSIEESEVDNVGQNN